MQEKLIIPSKIRVGFQERNGTYTGKLGYVIYYDNKGVLRKEASFESWRHKQFEPEEFDNVPTEGFVLNKKAGGYSSGWNHRQTYCRVYDPRGFEFEVTIPNLLYILQECDCSKGKGLEGKFVYSWDGKDLVLLPASSPEYVECVKFTKMQDGKVSAKELVVGYTYLSSKGDQLVYLGRGIFGNDKKYYFKDVKEEYYGNFLTSYSGLSSIKSLHSAEVSDDLSNILRRVNTSVRYNGDEFKVGGLYRDAYGNKEIVALYIGRFNIAGAYYSSKSLQDLTYSDVECIVTGGSMANVDVFYDESSKQYFTRYISAYSSFLISDGHDISAHVEKLNLMPRIMSFSIEYHELKESDLINVSTHGDKIMVQIDGIKYVFCRNCYGSVSWCVGKSSYYYSWSNNKVGAMNNKYESDESFIRDLWNNKAKFMHIRFSDGTLMLVNQKNYDNVNFKYKTL